MADRHTNHHGTQTCAYMGKTTTYHCPPSVPVSLEHYPAASGSGGTLSAAQLQVSLGQEVTPEK